MIFLRFSSLRFFAEGSYQNIRIELTTDFSRKQKRIHKMCGNNHICGNHGSVIIQSKTDHLSASIDVSDENKKNHVSSDSNEDKWKIWEQLYASRRLEIETQWQRIAFLATFIVLLLTGTGFFYFHFVLDRDPIYPIYVFNYCLTSLFLGGLLMISGSLWLAITKGSKYWTEVYEKKIELLEKELPIKRQYTYVEEFYVEKNTDDELLVKTSYFNPLKPDHESPSSVNCFIGVIIFLIGIFMFFLPSMVCRSIEDTEPCGLYCVHIIHNSCIIFLVIIMIAISFLVYFLVRHKCQKNCNQ